MKNPVELRYKMLTRDKYAPHDRQWIENFMHVQYRYYMDRELNLESPETFSEKLAWLKLNWHDWRLSFCADKARFQDYVRIVLPEMEDHFIRQIAIWDDPTEINPDRLPDKFILKLNCGSGKQKIIKDKTNVDWGILREELTEWLRPENNHYYNNFEPSYKGITSRIICEELIDYDHKIEFFCFGGEPRFYWMILNDKTPDVQASFFEMNGQKIPLRHKYPNIPHEMEQPAEFDELVGAARALSAGFPHVRVDFYKTKDSWYFCEMTFFHWGGLKPFEPEEYDLKFGKLIDLPAPILEDGE